MEINDLKNKILEKLKESSPGGVDVASILQKDTRKVKDTKNTDDQELAILKKSLDEYRDKLDASEFKNRELKKLYDEAVKKQAQSAEAVKKEKTVDGLEILKSRLTTLTKEARDKDIALSTLQESLRVKERKLSENDKLYKNIDAEKNELTERLQADEKQKKALNEKLLQVMAELEKKDKEVSEYSKRRNKDMEAAKNELELKLQSSEREKKALEGKVSQLNLEIDAKNKRLDELEGSYKNLDDMLKEAIKSERAAKADKEELEEQVSRLTLDIDALKSDVESRDNKIAADIKYYEKLLKEITELKAKDKR